MALDCLKVVNDKIFALLIRFKLRSGIRALPTDRDCDMLCKEQVKNATLMFIREQAQNMSELFNKVNICNAVVLF